MTRIIEKSSFVIYITFCLLTASPSWGQPNPAHSGNFSFSPGQKAEFLLQRGQYNEALRAFESLLKENAEDPYLFRGLVRAYQGPGRLAEAEGFLKEYLSAHSTSSAGHYGMGYYHYLAGNDPKAKESFATAIRLNEANAMAWNNLGASLSRTKSYTLALKKVKEAIRLEPDNSLFYNNLYRIFKAVGEAGVFIAEYQEYVRDGPKLVAQGYGRVLAKTLRQEAFQAYSRGNFEESIEKFSNTAEIYKEINHLPGLVATYFGLGILYEEKGEAAAAKEYFNKVLEINPNHLQAREKVK